MKIKMSEVDKMIKEEFHKMMEKKKLSTRLSQINEELEKMSSEDADLNEVEASGMQKTKSATGLIPGEQHGVKFEKIGTHLKEDEEEFEVGGDNGMELSGNEGGESIEGGEAIEGGEEGMGMGAEEISMGEFEAKFAEIGKAIDAKLGGGEAEVSMGSEIGDAEGTTGDDDFEEVEVQDEMGGNPESGESKEHEAGETPAEEKKEDEISESVDEPLEGHSVSQEAKADTMNDNMDKDTHVKEGKNNKGAVITENTKPAGKNIFTEGLDDKKKKAMMEEFNRMKKFAGLSKNDE